MIMWGKPWQGSYEMDEVFIDTAGWAVLFVRTEPQHAQASILFRQWKRQELDRLHAEANRLMLQKSYAHVLLKWRGHQVPNWSMRLL
jgi:hypothetical protein